MSKRSAVTMSETEITEFLDEQHTLVLAVPRGPDLPHVTPLWFVRQSTELRVWTYGRSQKVVSLRRDPRAVVMLEDGRTYPTLRGVSIDCAVEIVEDPAEVLELGAQLHRRYSGSGADDGQIPADVRAQAAKRVGLYLRPVRTRSWDHRKLG
jgi:PPOX class probable F420-dependent enzyme